MNNTSTFLYRSPFGELYISSDGEAITGISFTKMKTSKEDYLVEQACQELELYFSGKLEKFRVPMKVQVTPFSARVLDTLERVPYGQTLTYSDLAEGSGAPKAVRAAASVCANNQLPILLPCHRVLPASGGVGRYRGGVEWKVKLLELEKNSQLTPRRG